MLVSIYIGFKIHFDAKKARRDILEELEKEHFNSLISKATTSEIKNLYQQQRFISLPENIISLQEYIIEKNNMILNNIKK